MIIILIIIIILLVTGWERVCVCPCVASLASLKDSARLVLQAPPAYCTPGSATRLCSSQALSKRIERIICIYTHINNNDNNINHNNNTTRNRVGTGVCVSLCGKPGFPEGFSKACAASLPSERKESWPLPGSLKTKWTFFYIHVNSIDKTIKQNNIIVNSDPNARPQTVCEREFHKRWTCSWIFISICICIGIWSCSWIWIRISMVMVIVMMMMMMMMMLMMIVVMMMMVMMMSMARLNRWDPALTGTRVRDPKLLKVLYEPTIGVVCGYEWGPRSSQRASKSRICNMYIYIDTYNIIHTIYNIIYAIYMYNVHIYIYSS